MTTAEAWAQYQRSGDLAAWHAYVGASVRPIVSRLREAGFLRAGQSELFDLYESRQGKRDPQQLADLILEFLSWDVPEQVKCELAQSLPPIPDLMRKVDFLLDEYARAHFSAYRAVLADIVARNFDESSAGRVLKLVADAEAGPERINFVPGLKVRAASDPNARKALDVLERDPLIGADVLRYKRRGRV